MHAGETYRTALPLHQEMAVGPHKMLDDVKRQLWLTFLVYPLKGTAGRQDNFDAQVLKPALDSVERGLYSKLKQHYFCFASHFQDREQAGSLANEAAFWLAWMESLRERIAKLRTQATISDNGTPLSAQQCILQCAQFLVGLQFFGGLGQQGNILDTTPNFYSSTNNATQ